ncbi:MAG TPA: hypothetical protein VHM90_06560 [Phycisphaerae bacterium]|jgi:hypothetical protein|nr:hypothetical protein [Phycisphaerae bacterium]
MLRTLALTVLSLATVTACASQSVTSGHDFYHQQALHSATVSNGACDSVGQIVSTTPDYQADILAAAQRQEFLRQQAIAGASEPK